MSRERFNSFSSVFLSPLSSVPFLLVRPFLALLTLVPICISFLLFWLFMYLGLEYISQPTVSLIDTRWDWFDSVLQWIAWIILLLVVLLLSALLAFILITPIAAPFHDYVTERIERELLRARPDLLPPSQTIAQGIIHSIYEALRRVSAEVPILILIFAISFTPLIGAPTALMLGFLNAMFFLPVDAFSYSLDRRRLTLREKIGYLRAHRRYWRPIGIAMATVMLIPCNVLWFPPLAAVAATRMFCLSLLREEAIVMNIKNQGEVRKEVRRPHQISEHP